jgi:hypothetical protein
MLTVEVLDARCSPSSLCASGTGSHTRWLDWEPTPADLPPAYYGSPPFSRNDPGDLWLGLEAYQWVQVACPIDPEAPYEQGVDWLGGEDARWQVCSPGVYILRTQTSDGQIKVGFVYYDAYPASERNQPTDESRQVKVDLPETDVWIVSGGADDNGAMTGGALKILPHPQVAQGVADMSQQITDAWIAAGRPVKGISVGIAAHGESGYFRVGDAAFVDRDTLGTIQQLGKAVKGEVRSLEIYACNTAAGNVASPKHVMNLLAHALWDPANPHPVSIGGYDAEVVYTTPGWIRAGYISVDVHSIHKVVIYAGG